MSLCNRWLLSLLITAAFQIANCAIAEDSVLQQAATSAQEMQEKGLAVALEAERRDQGFGDTTATLTMELRLSADETIVRAMRQMILEVINDGDKSILTFDRPRDLKGTAILTHTHKIEPDDQWLYLPALKRVKRISSADKSGPFMGSEFAYEDLGSQEVEKYTYNYLREEEMFSTPCHVVERIPVDQKSGYSRQVTWYDQDEYRLRKVDYYDRKNVLLKSMTLSDYGLYLENYWRPRQMLMENHQTGKSTLLLFSNYQMRVGLQEDDFNRSALSRMR